MSKEWSPTTRKPSGSAKSAPAGLTLREQGMTDALFHFGLGLGMGIARALSGKPNPTADNKPSTANRPDATSKDSP